MNKFFRKSINNEKYFLIKLNKNKKKKKKQ